MKSTAKTPPKKVNFEQYIETVVGDKIQKGVEEIVESKDIPLQLIGIQDVEGNFFENFGKKSNISCTLVDINPADYKKHKLPSTDKDRDLFQQQLKSELNKNPDWAKYWEKIEKAHDKNPDELDKIAKVKKRLEEAYVFKIESILYVHARVSMTLNDEQRKTFSRKRTKHSSTTVVLEKTKEVKENPAEKRLQGWMQQKIPKYNANQKERSKTIPIINKKISFGRSHDDEIGILAVLFDIDLPQKKLVKPKDVEKYKSYTLKQKVYKTEQIALAQLKRWGVTEELMTSGEKAKMLAAIRENLRKTKHIFGRIMIGMLHAIYNDSELAKHTTHRTSLGATLCELMRELDPQYKVEQLPEKVRTPSDWLHNRLREEYKGQDKDNILERLQAVFKIDSHLTGAELKDLDQAKLQKLQQKITDEAEDEKAGIMFAKKEQEKFIACVKILDDAIKSKSHDETAQLFLEKTLYDVYIHYGQFVDMRTYTPLEQVSKHASAQIAAVNIFPDAGDLRTLAQQKQVIKKGDPNGIKIVSGHDDDNTPVGVGSQTLIRKF